jgi:ComF family protein
MPLPDVRRVAQACLSRAGKNAAGFFFPPLCIACRAPCSRENAWLCGRCESLAAANHESRDACPLCAQNRRFAECACEYAWDYPFERIYSLFDFDDTIKEITHAFKYGSLKRLAFFMGRSYACLVPPEFWEGMDIVVPVPLHFLRSLKRGYNQADHFAAGIVASRPGRPVLCRHALQRRRPTRTQTALARGERLRNLAGAFCVPSGHAHLVAEKGVVLVDDIVTTGATTSQCAQALLAAGARTVRVLSLARD